MANLPVKPLPAAKGQAAPVKNLPAKNPPHDGHANFTTTRVSLPSAEKPIASRNTSGAGRQGQRPQTIPNEFIYTPYPTKGK